LCEEIAVLSFFRRLLKCEQGATALEYTLIACLTGLVVLQVLQLPGSPTM
jgi:Flp pilus assembly pilin Flp